MARAREKKLWQDRYSRKGLSYDEGGRERDRERPVAGLILKRSGVLRLYKRKQITVPLRKNAAARCLSAVRPRRARNTVTIGRRNLGKPVVPQVDSTEFPSTLKTDHSLSLIVSREIELSAEVTMIFVAIPRRVQTITTARISFRERTEYIITIIFPTTFLYSFFTNFLYLFKVSILFTKLI